MSDAPTPDDAVADDSPTATGPTIPAELVGPPGSEVPPLGDEDADADPFGLAGMLGGGGLDLGSLMEQASQMQQQLADAQAEAAAVEIEGVAGGGAVVVKVTGGGEFRGVKIDPAVVDPADVEMLEDLVLAALHDATARVQELQSDALGGLGGLLGG